MVGGGPGAARSANGRKAEAAPPAAEAKGAAGDTGLMGGACVRIAAINEIKKLDNAGALATVVQG